MMMPDNDDDAAGCQIRMWSDRRAFVYLRAMTVRIQAKGRMLVAMWRYRLWKIKAKRTFTRGPLPRRYRTVVTVI
jgi:hypothetical protein